MGVRRKKAGRKKAGREAGGRRRGRGREGHKERGRGKQTKNLDFSLQTQLPGSGLGNI